MESHGWFFFKGEIEEIRPIQEQHSMRYELLGRTLEAVGAESDTERWLSFQMSAALHSVEPVQRNGRFGLLDQKQGWTRRLASAPEEGLLHNQSETPHGR